jgi:hypothetical protein
VRLLRGMGGALLWIASALIGLVGFVLCLTIILLPVGIPVLGIARRMFSSSIRLMLPRAVAHPVKETKRSARRGTKDVTKAARRNTKKSGKGIGRVKDTVMPARKPRWWRPWGYLTD